MKKELTDAIADYRAFLSMIHTQRPGMIAISLAHAAARSASSLVALVYGARILDALLLRESERAVFSLALTMLLLVFALNLLTHFLSHAVYLFSIDSCNQKDIAVALKCLTMDYQQMETPEIMSIKTRANIGVNTFGEIHQFCQHFAEAVGGCVSAAAALCMLGFLFVPVQGASDTPVIRLLNSPLCALALLLAVFGCSLLCIPLYKRIQALEMARGSEEDSRTFSVLSYELPHSDANKDIRAYALDRLLYAMYERTRASVAHRLWHYNSTSGMLWGGVLIVGHIATLLAYLFVGAKALAGLVSVGEISLYVGSITTLGAALQTVVKTISKMNVQRRFLHDYADFLAIPSEKYNGTLPIEKRADGDYQFEFKQVTFRYPGAKKDSLKDVTVRIRTGGKLAIVGPNGAGKTTFIKLLCRLYDPDEGQILLNGIDIKKYDYEEYRSLLSVVFQDFKLLSASLDQNVAASVTVDKVRAAECLKKAGFDDKLAGMEDGLDTILFGDSGEGVDISGGEAQKIAIARALYKDAPLVILDEPTAALDPFSEYEVYRSFDALSQGKTCIYISHRMSSCRFCDEILVLDGGRIAQHGTHESLLADDSGLYCRLWNAQSRHYTAQPN